MEETMTIAAIATPPGIGGIGIVRLSGPQSKDILSKVFFLPSGQSCAFIPRHLHYGHIRSAQGAIIDEVLAVFMPGPHSYTAEDVVEIHCHGGFMAVREILSLVIAAGARQAWPGEFSQRAFVNGRLDLAQAEAMCDLIAAKSKKTLFLAASQLSGALSKKVSELQERLLALAAAIEVAIDYPEEMEEDFAVPTGLKEIKEEVATLLVQARESKIYREGLHVAIVGAPNTGKSTLLNALLAEERAIVTDFAGTTRDTIEGTSSINGVPVVYIDTAGIRETYNMAEALGVQRSREAIASSDLVLLLLDASQDAGVALAESADTVSACLEAEKTGSRPIIILVNKKDIYDTALLRQEAAKLVSRFAKGSVLAIAAATGEGLDELRQEILALAVGEETLPDESCGLLNDRQAEALERALLAVSSAAEALAAGIPLDIVSVDIEEAYLALGQITGRNSSMDVIDHVFANFCLGK